MSSENIINTRRLPLSEDEPITDSSKEDTIDALGHEDEFLEYDPAQDTPEALSRRKFLSKVTVILSAAGGAIVGIPAIGYLIGPLFISAPEVWRAIGGITDFKEGETKQVAFEDASPVPWSGVAAQTAAWIRREPGDKFTAFAVNCTHLGCPVSWVPGAQVFLCPCHGGVYNKDGTVAAGPPPESLAKYPVRVVNGRVEVKATGIPLAGGASGGA